MRIPDCWPLHRALREELTAFWYWHQSIDKSPDATPEEAVRWHQQLRASAEAWSEAFGGCTHRSLGEVDERRDECSERLAAARPYLERLLDLTAAVRRDAARQLRAGMEGDRDDRPAE